MALEHLRELIYEAMEWEDRVLDEETEEVLVEGTPVNEVNLNRVEAGILTALIDNGLNTFESHGAIRDLLLEIDKNKKQRFLHGEKTLSNSGSSDGYTYDEYPYVLVDLPEDSYPQLNSPDYSVILEILDADDLGKIGELTAYDKTQNGFKVRMTGSAEEVNFRWMIFNPDIA